MPLQKIRGIDSVAQNAKQLPDAEQKQLLKQALPFMDLAQNVSHADQGPPPGWELVASSSESTTGQGFFGRIYQRTTPSTDGSPNYAVAFRGTDKASDISDIDSDLEIAFRKLPDQYWQALDFVEKTCRDKNIDPSDMIYTGHSLGGYLARTVGLTLDANKIWAFNSPGPTEKLREELLRQMPSAAIVPDDRVVLIRSKDDIVSLWGADEGVTIGVKTAGDSHGLASLRRGVTSAIDGTEPQPLPGRRNGLSVVFNIVARKLATSPPVQAQISRWMGQAPSRSAAKTPVLS